MNLRKCLLAVFFCTAMTHAQNPCPNPSPDSGLSPIYITSARNQGSGPCVVMDNDLATFWSNEIYTDGSPATLTFEFQQNVDFNQVQMAFYDTGNRSFIFDIEISNDGSSWTPVLSTTSAYNDPGMQVFDLGDRNAKYLRYVGKGYNHINNGFKTWNSIYEFRIVNDGGAPPPSGDTVWDTSGNGIDYTAGNVGIGTSALSSYKLAVDGKVRTREVRVDADVWADYVFENGYRLPTLKEVEKHITEKGHLINIPSATEVKANGIELGGMNRLLLEKIEELTLYIIELESKRNIQESVNNKIMSKLQKIEKYLESN